VGDVVQANLLAAMTGLTGIEERVFNVGLGLRTSLNELYRILVDSLQTDYPELREQRPEYKDFRPGDVRHSQADISLTIKRLGYAPMYEMKHGLTEAMDWYRS
jgi:UDP-N-acetylglucosamine 4-epimerase